jgi:hypothetical protein
LTPFRSRRTGGASEREVQKTFISWGIFWSGPQDLNLRQPLEFTYISSDKTRAARQNERAGASGLLTKLSKSVPTPFLADHPPRRTEIDDRQVRQRAGSQRQPQSGETIAHTAFVRILFSTSRTKIRA